MKRKSFTLIEILIAVAIFSTVLIIASGVFSNIIGNQSFVNVSTEVNREGQRILRQISDDTVNATENGKISSNSGVEAKGIIFLNADGSLATPLASCIIPSTPGCNFSQIAIFAKDGAKIYRFNSTNKSIEYGVSVSDPSSNQLAFNLGKLDTSKYKFSQLNNSRVEIISAGFSGISYYDSNCSIAPFVKIGMTVETADFSHQPARRSAKIELRTMVTSRSYQ